MPVEAEEVEGYEDEYEFEEEELPLPEEIPTSTRLVHTMLEWGIYDELPEYIAVKPLVSGGNLRYITPPSHVYVYMYGCMYVCLCIYVSGWFYVWWNISRTSGDFFWVVFWYQSPAIKMRIFPSEVLQSFCFPNHLFHLFF